MNTINNQRVRTLKETARDAGVSMRTLYRLFEVGEGPAVVFISERRRGVLDGDFDSWLMSRRRPAPGKN